MVLTLSGKGLRYSLGGWGWSPWGSQGLSCPRTCLLFWNCLVCPWFTVSRFIFTLKMNPFNLWGEYTALLTLGRAIRVVLKQSSSIWFIYFWSIYYFLATVLCVCGVFLSIKPTFLDNFSLSCHFFIYLFDYFHYIGIFLMLWDQTRLSFV